MDWQTVFNFWVTAQLVIILMIVRGWHVSLLLAIGVPLGLILFGLSLAALFN